MRIKVRVSLCAAIISNIGSVAFASDLVDVRDNLNKFSQANCLFGYFKAKGYDTKDIRAIAGGYVEMGTSPPEAYERIADYISEYKTDKKTKQNIDPLLLKCFYLDTNSGLNKIIDEYAALPDK